MSAQSSRAFGLFGWATASVAASAICLASPALAQAPAFEPTPETARHVHVQKGKKPHKHGARHGHAGADAPGRNGPGLRGTVAVADSHRLRGSVGEGKAGKAADDDDKKGGDDHDHGVETEDLFGFTSGSSIKSPGEKELESETVARFGKRVGSYSAVGSKLGLSFGVFENLNIGMFASGDCHRVRNVPDFEDVRGRCEFNGVGTEFRLRLLDGEKAPVGITLQAEPSFVRFDELSGAAGRGLGSENKLIFDKELVKDKLFGAVNLLYGVESFRERDAVESERGSTAGVSAALSYQLVPTFFVGGEVRYLRAYEGLALNRFQGEALYVGPTFFTKLGKNVSLSFSWNFQVAGREAVDRREVAAALAEAIASGEDPVSALPVRHSRLDLKNFERHQVRLKLGVEF